MSDIFLYLTEATSRFLRNWPQSSNRLPARRKAWPALAGLAIILFSCGGDPAVEARREEFRKKEEATRKYAAEIKQKQKQKAARQQEQQAEYRRRQEEQARRYEPAGTGSPSPADSEEEPVQYIISDKDLTFLVLNKIRLTLPRSTVSVSCQNGEVSLFGEIGTAQLRDQLIETIKKLPGVTKVISNELYVAAPGSK